MGIYRRGNVYWARWVEDGELHRQSLETGSRRVAERRFEEVSTDVSEFLKKGGGSIKCMIGDLGIFL